MKNILIPTDFSDNAWNALNYAVELFREDKCTFYLLNAFESKYFTTDSLMVPEPGEPAYDNAKNQSQFGLEHLKKKLDSGNSNHKFETISSYNTVLEAIRNSLQKLKIHLLVMGTEGKESIENRIYGSTALNVMEHIYTCPLLVIPDSTSLKDIEKKEIVFATNYKYPYTRKAVRYLAEIARKYSAAIRILYVQEHENLNPEQQKNKEKLQEYLKKVVHSFHTLTEIGTGEGIHSFIQSRGSHMLAISRKRHSFFYKFFSKSIIEEIGYKPQVPILILPDFNKEQ
ncbi:universal stress protein [Salegentibacter chungangensis]|uniref:Universal stress protein n=1 Tax=Salegentibacter chungangensis TaxID=1335724 RepID=A0ABW3NR12_9FLAO